MGRRPGAQARRFAESRYSLSAYSCYPSSSSAPAESATSSVELQPSAGNGVGLRDLTVARARPICFRPQPAENEYGVLAEYFGPPHPGGCGPTVTTGPQLLASSPKHCPVFASLRLRWRSAAFAVARGDFISILLTAKRAKSLFKRAGDGRASNRTELQSGRPKSSFRSLSRAWGNLVKMCRHILTISLFRRRRAVFQSPAGISSRFCSPQNE